VTGVVKLIYVVYDKKMPGPEKRFERRLLMAMDNKLVQAIDCYAAEQGISRSEAIRRLIKQALEQST